ncbi:MAG: HAD family hydrolase [Clostridia bacterium]|nr:HAD family hydrolase [Clostridia bacterium]MBR6187169.1 HAD family hydrolase [Clostridia bacterium]
MKKAVIFDLDGTLIHSLPDIAAAMNRTLKRFGLPVFPEEEYKYKVGNGVLKLTERVIGERREMFDQVLNAYKQDYAQNSQVNSVPFQGVTEMLLRLHENGLLLSVLTNKDQSDAENVLHHYFPEVSFAEILGRQEGIRLKPDPQGALILARRMNVLPQECWYVGDTATDMQCGNAAGMATVGVLWGYRPREELVSNGAGRLISAPDELVQLTLHF